MATKNRSTHIIKVLVQLRYFYNKIFFFSHFFLNIFNLIKTKVKTEYSN